MGHTIWYLEPKWASMGKRTTSVSVADISNEALDWQFRQQQIITQIQNFRDKVTMMHLHQDYLQHQLNDLQQSLSDLAIHRAR
ncbi:hypothetical protein ACFXTH_044452 [Malus domestica]